MKYLIVLGDGMADKNIPELDHRKIGRAHV